MLSSCRFLVFTVSVMKAFKTIFRNHFHLNFEMLGSIRFCRMLTLAVFNIKLIKLLCAHSRPVANFGCGPGLKCQS